MKAVGRLQAVIDRSWPRDNTNVWELVNNAGDHSYLKQHPTARFHEREVTAYRLWTAALGRGRAPVLLAADADLRSIVVTALAGQPARGLRVPADTESEIHRQAGMLLRRLHEAAPPVSGTAGCERVAARAEDHIQHRSSGLLEPAQVRLIRDHAAQLEEIAPLIPMVPTHGDAQVRNFLWDAPTQRLALINFERAELAPAVRDLVRLEYGPWHGQPYLRAAFLAGYGRTLTATEETALQNFAALDALSALQWGTAHNDKDVIVRAYRTLTRLSAEDFPRP